MMLKGNSATSVSELAERVGISDRYLRMLFEQYLGMSPKQYVCVCVCVGGSVVVVVIVRQGVVLQV